MNFSEHNLKGYKILSRRKNPNHRLVKLNLLSETSCMIIDTESDIHPLFRRNRSHFLFSKFPDNLALQEDHSNIWWFRWRRNSSWSVYRVVLLQLWWVATKSALGEGEGSIVVILVQAMMVYVNFYQISIVPPCKYSVIKKQLYIAFTELGTSTFNFNLEVWYLLADNWGVHSLGSHILNEQTDNGLI